MIPTRLAVRLAFLPALLSEGRRRGVGPEVLIPLVTRNPARRMGLGSKGTLTPGADADITVIDLDQSWTADRAGLESDAGFSIYEGETMSCKVIHTLSRGRFALRDGEIRDDSRGHGRYVARRLG